jgi:tRNA U34 2-thiouridine synthase MnmA/TrmU
LRVVLAAPEGAVTPGQACVMYDGDRVLGGGWIERPSHQQPLNLRRAMAASV